MDTTPTTQVGNELLLWLGLAAVVVFFVVSGVFTYMNIRTLSRGVGQVTHTHEVLTALHDILSLISDAETGQRGFVITGDEKYLDPYTSALARIDSRVAEVERLTADNPVQQGRIPKLKDHLKIKKRELQETIAVRRSQGFDATRAIVSTDRGQNAMVAIRNQVDEMEDAERALRIERISAMDKSYRVAILGGLLSGLLGAILSGAVGYLVQRLIQIRKRQEWLLAGENGLASAMLGDKTLNDLGDSALTFLARYLEAQAGAMFVRDGRDFRRVATYGVPAANTIPERFTRGDGLLGQAVKDRTVLLVEDVPEGYLTVGSALGQTTPRQLAILPATADRSVNAVLELGFLHPFEARVLELLDRVREPVGVAVRAAEDRTRLQDFLEETQRQSEELQAQGEELRVSNEELEEQGRALRESQSRLEQQQSELEQTNSQLEEQTQLLEAQRDDVVAAQRALELKARELEQASRYKSDFLANMSHELRTPLNSSLILAKLLADNTAGNLTDEQVQYADTIRAAGNDLLALINDILDLSKIEAGHMEIHPEMVSILELAESIRRTFEPLAKEKRLSFQIEVVSGCPDTIDTDRQRLEQVLKNLLSNAVKFTESGAVELSIRRGAGGFVAFAVVDTGIGIPPQQQELIFEAFRQAEGSTSRKYGGTGLGLSISRELTRLLGGELQLKSEAGRGSTFTVTVPEQYNPAHVQPRPSPAEHQRRGAITHSPTESSAKFISSSASSTQTLASPLPPPRIPDDRDRLKSDKRTILVVEDDEKFAHILFDLAHELDFNCLLATGAEEALAVALQYLPGAVILDVGLPDHSGLSVLDRLKHDARTRHIPVHVVSAMDYAETALALGAVGYMLKPVKREDLSETLKGLEMRLAKRVRRVLVVEDDQIQRDSVQRLLRSHDVETVGAATAAECLQLLKEATFDCMVLDLSLPDASGYSLLETLSREDAYSFPPVIVYTGRDISGEDEQKLRRYSKSIIIKGVKSPERLLDEVTLFLHQVVSDLPPEQQRMLAKARSRDAAIEGRRILIVEDDVRNVFALTSIFEPRGAVVQIARNGREALAALENSKSDPANTIDLVLMDVMMPEMDGLTATREIRRHPEWKKLPVIMLTAKAMKNDQEHCIAAGANDYMAKPLDVEKLLSLVRVWMPR